MNVSDELYQQTILDYNREPRNFQPLENPTHMARGLNPLCGDDYTVYLRVSEDGVIQEATFSGHGCALSKASASMMTEQVIGKTVEEAEALFESFHSMALHEGEDGENLPGGLPIFSNVWKYPERVKCAVLGWHAMKGALAGKDTVSTE